MELQPKDNFHFSLLKLPLGNPRHCWKRKLIYYLLHHSSNTARSRTITRQKNSIHNSATTVILQVPELVIINTHKNHRWKKKAETANSCNLDPWASHNWSNYLIRSIGVNNRMNTTVTCFPPFPQQPKEHGRMACSKNKYLVHKLLWNAKPKRSSKNSRY